MGSSAPREIQMRLWHSSLAGDGNARGGSGHAESAHLCLLVGFLNRALKLGLVPRQSFLQAVVK